MKSKIRPVICILLVFMMTASLAGAALAEEAIPEGVLAVEMADEAITEDLSVPEVPEVDVISEIIEETETEEPVVLEPVVEDTTDISDGIIDPEIIEEVPGEPSYEDPDADPEESFVLEEIIVSEESVQEEFFPAPENTEDPFLIPLVEQEFNDSEEVDEMTQEETNYVPYSTSIAKGKYNISVYRMQLRLVQLGYLASSQADGYFGDYTEGAVRLFQAMNGQSVNGIVSKATIDCMNYTAKSFYKLTKEMYNWPVYYMQLALISQGYLTSAADGYFGTYTYIALCLFQASNGLSVTGIGNLSTLTLLFSGTGKSNSFRNIKIGMQGTDASIVQYYLKKLGYYTGDVDGTYGAMTSASVSLFQAYNGWTYSQVSGVVDVVTYLVLVSSVAKPFKVLSKGDTGKTVNIVQNYLKDLGFLSSVSGTFDNATVEALKKFQKANKLTQNGTPSLLTLEKLFHIDAEGSSDFRYTVGSSGETVRKIQQKLYNLGYLITSPDGYFGSTTYAAVCIFQAANGSYYPNGVVNSAVYKNIMASNQYFTSLWAGCPVSSAVYAMQSIFEKNNMIDDTDGYFGDLTDLAVRQIQKMFGLPVTGVADATTLYYIYTFDSHLDNTYNVQGYYSNTNWLIFVNTTTNRCYIYKGSRGNWTLVYNWRCSTGADSTPTVLGEFTTNYRGYTFGDGVTYSCYYYTSFYGPYYLHSPLYKPYSWEDEDMRMGLNLSHGCIRLDVENAYWIWTNIPLGTKVVTVQ